MTTASSNRLRRHVAAVWPAIQAAVAVGLTDSAVAKQLKAFATPGEGTDARSAIDLDIERIEDSIAGRVTAVLRDTFDLCPVGLGLVVDRNGIGRIDGLEPVDAITRWATSVRDAELGWLISWIDEQPGVAAEEKLDAGELAVAAACGRRMVVPKRAAAVVSKAGLVHLTRTDSEPAAVRLPPTFRYVRHADFDLTWSSVDEEKGEIELGLVSRVRVTGWISAEARRYRAVDVSPSE